MSLPVIKFCSFSHFYPQVLQKSRKYVVFLLFGLELWVALGGECVDGAALCEILVGTRSLLMYYLREQIADTFQ